MKTTRKTIGGGISAIALVVGVLGFVFMQDLVPEAGVTTTGASDVEISQDEDYYTVTGKAERDYKPATTGEVEYCPEDELERPTCAYGELTFDLRNEAQARGRQDMNVDSIGWGHNAEVDIPALEGVEGSKKYHGYMYNRSHLVADSLGGDAATENLVTGTRTQNVGSTQADGQFSGGMAYTELMARDYLDKKASNDCPLYYAATPQYTGDELLPRTVIVDIQSCDKSIDERVEVSNTANGFDINYATGEYSKAA